MGPARQRHDPLTPSSRVRASEARTDALPSVPGPPHSGSTSDPPRVPRERQQHPALPFLLSLPTRVHTLASRVTSARVPQQADQPAHLSRVRPSTFHSRTPRHPSARSVLSQPRSGPHQLSYAGHASLTRWTCSSASHHRPHSTAQRSPAHLSVRAPHSRGPRSSDRPRLSALPPADAHIPALGPPSPHSAQQAVAAARARPSTDMLASHVSAHSPLPFFLPAPRSGQPESRRDLRAMSAPRACTPRFLRR